MIIGRNDFVDECFLEFCSLINDFAFIYIGTKMIFVVEYTLGVGRFKRTGSMI